MKSFHLQIAAPDGMQFDGEAVQISVRGIEGELAVLAGHIPFVTSVVACPCVITLEDGTKKTARMDGGLLTVDTDAVTLLSGSFRFDEE